MQNSRKNFAFPTAINLKLIKSFIYRHPLEDPQKGGQIVDINTEYHIAQPLTCLRVILKGLKRS